MTARQEAWKRSAEQAAREGNGAAGLFALVAQPNARERSGHRCQEHLVPATRAFRRCGICGAEVPTKARA